MKKDLLDLYTDYLLTQNHQATATGLSALLEGEVSHDKVTRFLHATDYGSKELWCYVKPLMKEHQHESGGVLILDDRVEEKAYTDENDLVCWHYSHAKGRHVKGINLLSCLARYEDVSLPVGYTLVKKDVQYCDIASKKQKRKASVTKNEQFRQLIKQASDNQVSFDYILADNWFGAKANLFFIHQELKKQFIFGMKSNRLATLDANSGQFKPIKSLDPEEGKTKTLWLKGLDFPVQLLKKTFTNEDQSTGILYLVTNDLSISPDRLYEIYHKRWRIEEYHKIIKQHVSLAKSPTRTIRSQCKGSDRYETGW